MWHVIGAVLAALWMTFMCWGIVWAIRTTRRTVELDAPEVDAICDCGTYRLDGFHAHHAAGWVHERRACFPDREWII